MKWLVRGSIPIAAILVPAAFFLSVLSPDATTPNGLIYPAYVGAVLLAVGVLVLGVGLGGGRVRVQHNDRNCRPVRLSPGSSCRSRRKRSQHSWQPRNEKLTLHRFRD